MAEKKPGLLKRMFSFGFGKNNAEEEVEAEVKEATPVAQEATAEAPKKTPSKKPAEKAEKKTKNKAEPKPAPKADDKPAPQKAKPVVEKKAPKTPPAKKAKAEKLAKAPEPKEVAKTAPKTEAKIESEPKAEPKTQDAPKASKPSKSSVTLTERKSVADAEPDAEPVVKEAEQQSGWLSRLTKGLSRSSEALTENITKVFTDKKLDDDTLQDLEDVLLQADLGIETATKIIETLSAQKFGKTVTDQEVREIMADEIEKILSPVAKDLDLDLQHQPHVILMIGVNGSGKTTTIGKLSQKLYDAGFSTSLVAGDTFRAAAVEQLKIWGERTQSPVLFRETGADAAGLAFDAWDETHQDRRDVMLMDTAGRLQNRTELMDELEKIVRVLKKQDESAPHTVLLTLDATTGQNALNQVEIFKEVAGVNGLVMTKLDGTARGGILVAIAAKYNLPVYFIGVGEGVEDLEPFEARDFARSIAGLPKE